MAQKLLFRKQLIKLHIALFVCIALCSAKLTAQSVLLPGDVVIVSANTDTQSIDFIPLIDIEAGTTLYFSAGAWNDSTQSLSGEELSVEFLTSVEAGSNIHINGGVDKERFNVSGSLHFEGPTHRLFAYQKEEGFYRHLFALGWGEGTIWNFSNQDLTTSDIPKALMEEELFLTFGPENNHQYFIRNGASGTRNLLLKFVTEEANWRSSNSAFTPFGTSFNLLAPPVVLFERSVSTVEENDSIATLNVSIYEHDGSRLTVDVVFDSLQSILSMEDTKGFTSETLNFTGLIGDAMYEVHVPIADDADYEGRETGIFRLQNLSKGNFGDFLTHSLVVNDNEQPDVSIVSVVNSRDTSRQITIRNTEDGVVSLNGWALKSGDVRFTFPQRTVIYPQSSITIFDDAGNSNSDSANPAIHTNLEKPLLSESGGTLQLLDYKDGLISEMSYNKLNAIQRAETKAPRENIAANTNNSLNDDFPIPQQQNSAQVSLVKTSNPGWKMIKAQPSVMDAFPETKWMYWNEKEAKFTEYSSESDVNVSSQVLFAHFEDDKAQDLNDWAKQNIAREKDAVQQTISWNISATDINENGSIDRLEGLNLLLNDFNRPLSVRQLLLILKTEHPGIEFSSSMYTIHQRMAGELDFEPLTETDSIAAKAPFWIMVKNEQESIPVSISEEQFNQTIPVEQPVEENEAEKALVNFTFAIPDSEIQESLEIRIGELEIDTEAWKDLESYPELQLGNKSFFQSSFSSMGEYYTHLDISPEISSAISVPVYFDTDRSGPINFSVTGWENIPGEWEIKLEDKELSKEYNLRSGFTLNFDYNGSSRAPLQETADIDDQQNEREKNHRFVLHVIPPGAENQEPEEVDAPRELELYQNYPNPFNPITTISFYLPEPKEVKLSVFNIVGQPIAVITEGMLSAGEKHFEWDARDRPSGMYIYQLEVGNKVMTRKMTLVK